jgi:hypothetical protein
MTTAGRGEVWTGTQLAARLVALNGVAPEPVQYIIFRSTRHADGRVEEGHNVPNEKRRLNDPALDFWLARHGLAGGERLAVAVLVIRETLDEHGLIRQCTLERRRGSADGPFYGDPARVDFTAAAGSVRLYRSRLDGRLTEIPPSADTAPPHVRSPEQFAGERQALLQRFGDNIEILDVREPLLFEDMVGLSSIVHVRTAEGREVGCGIGWHGSMPFVLEADFPRFGTQLTLLADDAEAIDTAVRANGLVRYETRLDEHGLAVVARRKGGAELLLLRLDAGQVRLEPCAPGRGAADTDQQRWMRYAETYEGRTILDAYHDGTSDDLIVLTGDSSGRIWRHHIDGDGVETWRKTDDEVAVGTLHREKLFPGTLAALDAERREVAADPQRQSGSVRSVSAASLLGKIEAYGKVIAALHAAQEAAAGAEALAPDEWYPDALVAALRELQGALVTLEARVTAASVHDMVMRLREGALRPGTIGDELGQIEARLHNELAPMRFIIAAPARAHLLDRDQPAFGAEVAECFPSASYDIEEAALCLALRRPTAAVFHCMKVLQSGIGAFARFLDLADPSAGGELSWRQIVQLFRSGADKHADDLCDTLEAVRQRWRNAVLKPADKYTEEEAELIFHSLGGFMRALAGVCDEHGQRPAR